MCLQSDATLASQIAPRSPSCYRRKICTGAPKPVPRSSRSRAIAGTWKNEKKPKKIIADCKHNYDLHTYRRGALHSWPGFLLYRHGSFWDSTARWQERFWRAPAGKIVIEKPGSAQFRSSADASTVRTSAQTLPSRAHLQDDARRRQLHHTNQHQMILTEMNQHRLILINID